VYFPGVRKFEEVETLLASMPALIRAKIAMTFRTLICRTHQA
jgi:hypothetical protein